MAKPKKPVPCQSFEVCGRDANGNVGSTPFSDTLAYSGVLATQALTKIRMLEEIGWPYAKAALKDDKGRKLIVKKDSLIWLLKCKPSCWRLYFYVQENDNFNRIIYVYAVCKQSDQEDPQSARTARSIVDDIPARRSAITAIEFPAN